jgi:acid stress chaperone HdeB
MLVARLAALSLALGLCAGAPARAQVVDISTIKCQEFLSASNDDRASILLWLAGYYASENEETVLDFGKLATETQKLAKYCSENPTIGLLNATEKAWGN